MNGHSLSRQQAVRIGWFKSARGWWLQEQISPPIRDSYEGEARALPSVFLLSVDGINVSGVARAKSAGRSDSFQKRLHFDDWLPLNPFDIQSKIAGLGGNSRTSADNIVERGVGGFTRVVSNHIIDRLLADEPMAAEIILEMLRQTDPSDWLHEPQSSAAETYREQFDGVKIALELAGFDRIQLLQQIEHPRDPDNLNFASLVEDQIVYNDIRHFLDWEEIPHVVSGTQFLDLISGRVLQVFLANRLPIEQQTGADIIYYVHDFDAFVLVQYKRCKRENGSLVYRPDAQLTDQIQKMRGLQNLWTGESSYPLRDYRAGSQFCYIKCCPTLQPLKAELSDGKYFDIPCFKESLSYGPRGGRVLRYADAERYLTNTLFCTLVSQGWIGSSGTASERIMEVIETATSLGRSVLFAEMDLGGRRGRSWSTAQAVMIRGFAS